MNVFGDVAEHRSDDPLEDVGREFVGELELDLAGVGCERAEPPFAVQVAERAVPQRDDDRLARRFTLSVVKCARTPW